MHGGLVSGRGRRASTGPGDRMRAQGASEEHDNDDQGGI
jgi:hypothetical protein